MRTTTSRFKAMSLAVGLGLAWTLVLSPTTSQADPISVQSAMGVGDQWRCSVSTDVFVSRTAGGDDALSRTVQSAQLTLKAMRLGDDGSIVVQGRFDRLTAVWRRGETQYEFTYVRPKDENKADGAADHPVEPNQGARNGAFANVDIVPPAENKEPEKPTDADVFKSAFRVLVSRPFELVVSSEGEITDVVGLGESLRVLATAEGLDSSAFGMFLPPKFAEALEPLWSASGAGAVHQLGDSWEQSRAVDLGPAGAIELTTTWAADKLKRQTLNCSGALSITTTKPERVSASQPSVDIAQASGTSSLTWSLADQRLMEWKEDLTLSTRWRLGDIEIKLTQLSKRRLHRLD